jgi:hypothetical protein
VVSLNDVNASRTLSNPYPNGIRPTLQRSQLTPDLNIGQASSSGLLSLATPYYQQWNFSLQHSIGKSLLLETAYAGNKGTRVVVNTVQLNVLTADQMALGTVTQQLVPNPFYGVITDPTSAIAGPQVARRVLMLPYPQYTTVSSENPSLGNSIYHSLQTKVEKRFSRGFTLLASFTAGKTLTNATSAAIQNPRDLRLERSLPTYDVARRLVFSGVYELPVGRGKRFGAAWGRVPDTFLGGWQLNGIASFQGGMPLALTSVGATRPDRIRPVRELSGPVQSRLDHYFDTDAFAVPKAFTYGNAPPTIPDIRAPGINNFDLSAFKSFRVLERLQAQLRFEAFNAFNRVQFGPPGLQAGSTAFGVITSQANQPRKLQVAAKLIF